MTIGERIKSRREELGMTQDELAKRMGYKSRSSINKIEVAREVTLKTISRLSVALDCSEAYLMGWEEDSTVEKAISDAKIIKNPDMIKTIEMLEDLSESDRERIVQIIKAFASASGINTD